MHIIHRQFLDVEFDGRESGAAALQNRLLEFCQNELGSALERVLDQFAPAKMHWAIDRLDIDAGTVSSESFDHLVEAVTQGLERQLREWAPRAAVMPRFGLAKWEAPEAGRLQTEAQLVKQAFLYFLSTGVLPWSLHLPLGKTLEDMIREIWEQRGDGARAVDFARSLGNIFGTASVRKRIIRQFSSDFLNSLLASVSEDAAAVAREIFAGLRTLQSEVHIPAEMTEQVWEHAFLNAFAGQHVAAATLIAAALTSMPVPLRQQQTVLLGQMEAMWPQSTDMERPTGESEKKPKHIDLTPTGPRKSEEETSAGLDLHEGVFIQCAGIVLLHPFLPRFFKTLGIVEGDKLLQPERALWLMHYLVTGQAFAPEYDLFVAKVLCNLPLDAPVNSRMTLTVGEEEEAAALLASVIRHWSALGDTSVENLRGSFLVRPGKLSQRDDEYVLQMEARAYDILLDNLPWGLGLIQLPWMRRILWVEWRF